MKDTQLATIRRTGIVAVIRSSSGDQLVDVCSAFLAGGVEVMEITFTVPQAHRVLERVADKLGDKILLGAGTVLDSETARIALLAGAQFIVSPTVNLDIIRLCRRYDKLVMPGAFTPTEVMTAWEAGADLVKIFPSDFTGPSYLKVLHGPFPQIRLMPTGGVTLETAPAFLQAGAYAVGVGGALVDQAAIKAGDMAKLELLARAFSAVVAKTKAELAK